MRLLVTAGAIVAATGLSSGQSGGNAALEAETLKHFQALIQADTSNPPGNEIRAVDYLKKVLDAEGIPYQVFAKDPQRPNLVVRIKGNGKKRPVLVHGPHRRGHRGRQEVDVPAVRRDARRRLRLRPRHRGRQGQPGRRADARPAAAPRQERRSSAT